MQPDIDWESPKNHRVNGITVIPTIVSSETGEILGLAYSTKESLKMAIEKRAGIYYSRSRGGIWIKGEHMRNRQVLLKIKWDCDRDSLVFVVKQRGDFCHVEGCNSCFAHEMVVFDDKPVRLSYATGYCEPISFNFLKTIGINVFSSSDRSRKYLVKSDLATFSLQGWKPKDIRLSTGYSDMILYYKDLFDENTKSIIDSNFITLPLKLKPVRVCLVSSAEKAFPGMRVATEYPQLNRGDYNYITTHGNSEEYVINGFCDAAIVTVVSGKTIRDMGLNILQDIVSVDMSLMISKAYYYENPRVCREIRNVIENDHVYFYSVDGPNGVFSNFYPCRFVDDNGVEWSSSEHYYQAHKFMDPRIFEMVRKAKTAKDCYKLSWSFKEKFRSDWITVKDEIMRKALQYKFYQNQSALKALISTGDKILVEHAMNDLHYGSGINGEGKNMLGKLLMELRDTLKSKL